MTVSNQAITVGASIVNRSGSITTGGTAQDAIASNSQRRFLLIQNPLSETENLFVDFGRDSATDGTSFTLAPGAAVIFDSVVPCDRVSVNAATTGHKFIMKDA